MGDGKTGVKDREANKSKKPAKPESGTGSSAGAGTAAGFSTAIDSIDLSASASVFRARNSLQRSPQSVVIGENKLQETAADEKSKGKSNASSRQSKRRRREDSEGDIRCEWLQVEGIKRELTAFVLGDNNKVNKSAANHILDAFACMETIVQELIEKNARLEGRLHERDDVEKLVYRASTPPPKSASDVVRRREDNAPRRAESKKNVIVVRPDNDASMDNSEEVKKEIVKTLKTKIKDIRVKNLRKLRDKSVVMELATDRDLRVVEEEINKNDKLKVKRPAVIRPRMIIYDIDKGLEEAEVLDEIYEKKLRNKGVSREEFDDSFKVIFRTGKRDARVTNYVVRVSGNIRRAMLAESRIFINWGSHRTQDFVALTRCYKCQSFGHVQKACRRERVICGHCAREGHEYKDCPDKKEDPICFNCKLRRRESSHSVDSRSCPEYIRAVEFYKSSIDYA